MAAEVRYNSAWYTLGGAIAKKNVTVKSYTPFGEQIGEAVSGFGFNGEYYNATTGQIYLRARFYEPEMARFGQKDIVRGSITDALSLNRYSYCENDPINFCDPSGMRMVIDSNTSGARTTVKSVSTPAKAPATVSASNSAAARAKVITDAKLSAQQDIAKRNSTFISSYTDTGTGSNAYKPKVSTTSPAVQSPVQGSGNCKEHKIVDLAIEAKVNAVNKFIDFFSGEDQNVAAIGMSASAGLGLDLALSIMLVMDRSGNMGIDITVGVGGGLGASVGGGGYSNPNAELIGDLSGVGVDIGGTVTIVTLDADNSGGMGVSIGDVGLEFHALITKTFIIDIF